MRYEHLIAAVCGVPWAILSEKLHEIMAVLAYRASGDAFTSEEIQARIGSRSAGVAGGGAIGVLPIRGTIAHRMGGMSESSGGVSVEGLGATLNQMMANESLGTILLDIDSPGGAVTGVSEFAQQLYDARGRGTKRIVALVNGMAASAAYWIASQADEIISIPSGVSGSIGVFTAHEDLSAALEQHGVKMSLIYAGKHKVDGNPFEPLSDEHRAFMQGRVDEAYAQFVKDVARGRGVTPAEVRNGFGQGRALTAKDAKAAGLVDRVATVDETLARLSGRKTAAVGGPRADAVVDEIHAHAAAEGSDALTVSDEDRARRLRMA